MLNNYYYLKFEKFVSSLNTTLLDENSAVSALAMSILSDILKLASKAEIQNFIDHNILKSKNNENSGILIF